MDWPDVLAPNGPSFGMHHPWGPGGVLCGLGSNAAGTSGAWPAANLALFMPFVVTRPVVIENLAVVNGSTASGNIDMGLYAADGTRLVSVGSTAQAGTSAAQVFDITDTLLGVGRYYLALALDNATGTVQRAVASNAVIGRFAGMLEQTSAFPLPATASFAAYTRTALPNMAALARTTV